MHDYVYWKDLMKFYLAATLLLLSFTNAQAGVLDREGKWSFYYGYNRASYSNSDYHLTGNNYDFTLKNVRARDAQAKLEAGTYIAPWAWSVPQNNIRFGYFLSDNLSISFGNDHMKYVMIQNQTVDFEGYIATDGINKSGSGTQTLSEDFLKFEHTDGLNFVSVELEHFVNLWSNAKETQALSLFWGPGLAIMIPRTNSTLFGRARNDEFHLAGTGYSLKLGFEYNINHRYFTRLVVKHGNINIDDARTTSSSSDKLSHRFDFKETYIVLGVYF